MSVCRLVPLVLLAVLPVSSGSAHAQGGRGGAGSAPVAPEQAARKAAQEWLQYVANGAWEKAWTEASPVLRTRVPQEQWTERGNQAQKTLGVLRSRKLIRLQHRDSLRQVPDSGPFVLLRYRSEFGAGLYTETVLTVKDNEAWRVAGYEVAPVVAPTRRRSTSSRRQGN